MCLFLFFFKIFKIRISDPACNYNEPSCYLDSNLEHPLFMEAIDQALALCSDGGGPSHVKLVLEWNLECKKNIIADDKDVIEEHSSVKTLRCQALHGKYFNLIKLNTTYFIVRKYCILHIFPLFTACYGASTFYKKYIVKQYFRRYSNNFRRMS